MKSNGACYAGFKVSSLDKFWIVSGAAVLIVCELLACALLFTNSPKGIHAYGTQIQGRNRPVRADAPRTGIRGGDGWESVGTPERGSDSGDADSRQQRVDAADGYGRCRSRRAAGIGPPERY